MTKRVPEVLFVCVHNAGRSQMAAGLLDQLSEGRVHVRTAGSERRGLWAYYYVNPEAVEELSAWLSR